MFFVDLVVHNVVTSDLFRFRLKLDIFSYLENPAWNFLTEGQMEERDIIIKDNQGHFFCCFFNHEAKIQPNPKAHHFTCGW